MVFGTFLERADLGSSPRLLAVDADQDPVEVMSGPEVLGEEVEPAAVGASRVDTFGEAELGCTARH